jgi:hypothetical protein
MADPPNAEKADAGKRAGLLLGKHGGFASEDMVRSPAKWVLGELGVHMGQSVSAAP